MVRIVLALFLTYGLGNDFPVPVQGTALAGEMPPEPAGTSGDVLPGDLVKFYPRATVPTASPPDLSLYEIECSEWVGSYNEGSYFTLAYSEDGKTALFVFADRKRSVTDLEEVVSFGGQPERSLSWGFLYDRNGDGWVDYFSFLDGAQPVKNEKIARKITRKHGARRGDPIKIESEEELLLMIEHARLVFTHNADDNFDGKSDGVIAPTWEPENPYWIYGCGVLRSTDYTTEVDEDWTFIEDITNRSGSVPRGREGFEVSFFTGGNPLETSSLILESINEGIRACRIPAGTLPGE